ncbi:hypothetical protein [Geobacter grbiciae]|uniref:hypothetical protein n=1 Tax=Geobacter grbiciae TaxID=155042 RepID=UPI001C022451|nr:hypothetical protein [Geobacter grbiciae]MBT1075311.1 hypothetical protein [Geobacter grbiciae]
MVFPHFFRIPCSCLLLCALSLAAGPSAHTEEKLKAIYNRAFRAPTIEQTSAVLKTGNKLKTATADVLELEASHRFDARSHATVNLFDIRMNHPINYYYDFVNSLDAYKNEGRIGTQRVEAEYQFRGTWEVNQIAGADNAKAFWRRAIGSYTGGAYREDVYSDPYWGTVTRQQFRNGGEG